MTFAIHKDSHLDHGLTAAHLAFIVSHFANRTGFFTETVTMPDDLPDLTCGLYGPIMGDPPVTDNVSFEARGERAYPSRTVALPTRPTRLLTVIAGPHKGAPCVLYTAHGGPKAPREAGDPTLQTPEDVGESIVFWATHALARPALINTPQHAPHAPR
jgi:hypothetical protein